MPPEKFIRKCFVQCVDPLEQYKKMEEERKRKRETQREE